MSIKKKMSIKKWNKNIDKYYPERRNAEILFNNFLRLRKRKDKISKTKFNKFKSWLAGNSDKQVVILLKKLRAKYPFIPVDYSVAKKKYEEYFTLDNHIPSYDELYEKCKTEDVYLYCFREEAPVKGNTYASYFVNTIGLDQPYIMKVDRVDPTCEKIDYINGKNHSGNSVGINKDFTSCWLYATEEQIKEFHEKELKYKEIEEEIKEAQKVVRELYKKQSEI